MHYLRPIARGSAALATGLAYAVLCLTLLGALAVAVRGRRAPEPAQRMRYVKAAAGFSAGLAVRLAFVVLCLSLAAVVATVVAPRVSGVRFATVLSDSMRPDMSRGDMLIVRRVDPARIEVGDVILFRSRGDPDVRVAHRVVNIVNTGGSPSFVTKGDANEAADRSPVPADRVLGKVQFDLPLVGHVTGKMKEPLVLLLALAVPGAFIIGSETWNIVRAVKREKPRGLGAEPGRDP